MQGKKILRKKLGRKLLEPVINIEHVRMEFNIANEQLNSVKEYVLALIKGKLKFKPFVALDDINITINRGDVYGIVGTNGSGKSTLLKIIAGVLEPTSGKVTVNGTISPLIELGAGFDIELTAKENVYLNGALLGYTEEFIKRKMDSIIAFAELEKFADLPLKNYSSGMIARLAFSIATAAVPDVLIVDEALAVGDRFFKEKCEKRIKELVRNHGTTLLFVSHALGQVQNLCEKAVWIEKGEMMMAGSVDDVCAAYDAMEKIKKKAAKERENKDNDNSKDNSK